MQEFKQWLTELVVHEDVNLSSSTSLSCAPRQMAMVDDRAEHFRHARSSDVGAQAQMTKSEERLPQSEEDYREGSKHVEVSKFS